MNKTAVSRDPAEDATFASAPAPIASIFKASVRYLRQFSHSPEAEALLFFEDLGFTYTDVFLGDKTLSRPLLTRLIRNLKERSQGMPVQYILKKAFFYGKEFFVDAGALIPRPETEVLVDLVVREISKKADTRADAETPLSVLEVGTGSGAVLASVMCECIRQGIPDAGKILFYGVEIDATAYEITAKNLSRYGSNLNYNVIREDFFYSSESGMIKDRFFDIIYSNPPYIPEADFSSLAQEVRREPKIALVGGEKGTEFYEKALPVVKEKLLPGGVVLWEIGKGQDEEIKKMMEKNGFLDTVTEKDLTDTNRFIIGRQGKNV